MASGCQHAAELAQIAVGSCGHDRLLMGLREASDELHSRRRQVLHEASMTVSEPQPAEGAAQNAFHSWGTRIGLIANDASVEVSSPCSFALGQWQLLSDCQIHMSDFHYLKLRCRMRVSRIERIERAKEGEGGGIRGRNPHASGCM